MHKAYKFAVSAALTIFLLGIGVTFAPLMEVHSAGSFTCANTTADLANGQAAINANANGTLNISGQCGLSGGQWTLSQPITLQGAGAAAGYTLLSGNQNNVLKIAADNVTVKGFWIQHGSMSIVPSGTNGIINNNATVLGNKISDLTNGGGDHCYPNCSAQPAIDTTAAAMVNFILDSNIITNIWGGGYPYNPYSNTGATQQSQCQAGVLSAGTCILDGWGSQGLRMSGMDHSTIIRNLFDQIGNDAIYMQWSAFTGNSGPHRTTTNNLIADNEIKHVRRIPMEIQSQPSYPNCSPAGTCDGGVTNIIGLQIRGNYVHAYSYPYYQSYGCSCVPDGNLNGLFFNNTFIADQAIGGGNGQAAGWEMSLNNGLDTGNVVASGSPGYNPAITGSGNSSQSFTTTVQNNIHCGNSAVAGPIGSDVGSTTNAKSAKYVDQWNYKNTSCPAGANLNASSIATTWTSANNQQFASGSSGTWALTVVSNLSIRNVSFYIDGSSTAAFVQYQAGVNTNFASDRKWPYSFSTGATLSGGSHTIAAVATDASGASSPQIVQNFTVGTSTSPIVTFGGAAVNNTVQFGPQNIGVASQQQFALTNTGGANLTFTQSSSPSGDYTFSSTCAALLSPGQSCTISVTFTPTVGGTRTGTYTLTDNAAGSPHVVNFTGTGLAASGCIPTPPNLVLAGVCDGSTYPNANTGFGTGGTTSTLVAAATGPGGSSALHLTVVGTPNGLEVAFNNLNLAPSTNYTATLNVRGNRPQVGHALVIDQSTFAPYGLDVLPNITTTATLLSYNFTTPAVVTPNNSRFTLQLPNIANTDTMDITNAGIVTGAAQSTITNLAASFISHSQVRLTFNAPSNYIGLRVRVSTNDCATGDTTGYGPTNPVVMKIGASPTTGASTIVGGLTPAVAYTACPELTADGNTWTSGVSVPFTTLAAPATDPALPVDTTRFNTDYPDTTNAFIYTNSSNQQQLLGDCSDFQAAYQAATSRLQTQTTIINVPAGPSCQALNYSFATLPPDVHTWTSSAVSGNQITLGGSTPITELQGLTFGRTNAASTAYPSSTSCPFGTGLATGPTYYAHIVNSATNTVQLYCPDKTTLMTFTDVGSSTTGGFFWASLPRQLQWIILKAATPLGQLPPEHAQVTKAWQPKFAGFIDPVANVGNSGQSGQFITFGPQDPNPEPLISNIRIGPGIEITTADAPESHTSVDPDSWFNLIVSRPYVSNVIFDRDYIHGKGSPNRITNAVTLDGSNIAIVDSYHDGIAYYHSEYSGLATTQTSSTTFTIQAGTYNMGQGPVNVQGPRTVTLTGNGVSGRVYAGLDMTAGDIMTIWLPAGVTGSCSGVGACAISNQQFNTGDGSCGLGGNWKRDTQGQSVAAPVACVDLIAGSINAVTMADSRTSTAGSADGSRFIATGFGPGPTEIKGNYFEGAGTIFNYSSTGTTQIIRGNANMERNYFKAPLSLMFGSPTSDGLSYFQRVPVEVSGMYGFRFRGNVIDGSWAESLTGALTQFTMLAMPSVNGQGITDANVEYNTFMHGPGLMNIPSILPGSMNLPTPPTARFRARNNLAFDIGSSFYWVNRTAPAPTGWLFVGPNGTEDFRIEHNTLLSVGGTIQSVLRGFDTNVHGARVTDNIFGIDSTTQGVTQDPISDPGACGTFTGKAYIDCKMAGYTWTKNLMVPLNQSTAQVQAAWPTLANYFQTGATGFANVGFWAYQTPQTILGFSTSLDFHLNCSAGFCPGTSPASDGHAIGVDVDELKSVQGWVTCCFVSPTANQVSYVAADTKTCTVDLSTTANDADVVNVAFRFVDAGVQRQRTVPFPGLTAKKLYYGMVRCNGYAGYAQQPFSFFAH